jgi:hypothetical protein
MMGIFPLSFLCIIPDSGPTPWAEMRDCLQQLQSVDAGSNKDTLKPLKLTFFLRAESNSDFSHKRSALTSILHDFFPENRPAVSFIAQPPEEERHLALEATFLENPGPEITISYRNHGEIPYTLVQAPHSREVYAAGMTMAERDPELLAQSQGAFEIMQDILAGEGMDLGHIVRQWNYIEDIVDKKAGVDGERQNYQVFNDVRTTFYANADFKHGYPSATGIGTNAGGIVLECIATDTSPNIKVVPLSNPGQEDAHRYSQDVLVGAPIASVSCKTSPKFERAKLICDSRSGWIYVSGTASIRGEETVGVGDVEVQTWTTIENIAQLTSPENLRHTGFQATSPAAPFAYLRVYVKKAADIPCVKKICSEAYGPVPSLFVVSDICRPELLVEIEGAVFYPALDSP